MAEVRSMDGVPDAEAFAGHEPPLVADFETGVVYSITSGGDVRAVAGYERTAAEIAASVTPTNYAYAPGNVLRYGTNTTPGTTDMTAAIQAAVNSGVGFAYIPSGTYALLADIELLSNITLYGDGQGTSLVGNLASSTDPAIYATGRNNVTIRDISIGGTHSWGIYITGGTGHRIERCSVSGGTRFDATASKGGGIFLENVSGVVIKNNVLSGNGVTNTVGYYDILCNFGTYAISDSEISSNSCTSSNVEINIALFDPRRVIVTSNIVANADTPSSTPESGGYGILLYNTNAPTLTNVGESVVANNVVRAVDGSGIYIANIRDVAITGNTVIDSCSVQLDTSVAVGGIAIHQSPGCAVSGNIIIDSGLSGIQITNSESAYTLVSGNVVRDTVGTGISIRGTAVDISIVGNTVENCGQDAIGMWSDTVATRISVVGNTVRPNNAGGFRGIYMTSNTANWVVTGNNVSATSGSAISNAGTGNVIYGNVGWVTESRGTGTINSGSTTSVITHGLSVTPTVDDISITFAEQGTNDYGRYWVSGITSTQFTLNVSSDPGASNLDFGWRAEIR